jgi:hypothetical protein
MQRDFFGHVVRVWLLATLDVSRNIFKCPGELTKRSLRSATKRLRE